MPLIICPICDQPFETERTATTPFCSDRCRLIDLSRWINEEYGLPVERAEDPSHESQVEE
jgi:endogenous inhibitor of DNA gyrase (YacG/DUF329 family)